MPHWRDAAIFRPEFFEPLLGGRPFENLGQPRFQPGLIGAELFCDQLLATQLAAEIAPEFGSSAPTVTKDPAAAG